MNFYAFRNGGQKKIFRIKFFSDVKDHKLTLYPAKN